MTVTRKMCRSGQRCEIRSLADAIDCCLHHSDLPLSAIAERIGRRETYLRAAASPNDDAHPFRADLIVPVTVATGNPAILDYLERQVGRLAVSIPDVPASHGDLFEALAVSMRELGEDAEAIRGALADDREISPAEAERICREIEDSVKAQLHLKAIVMSRVRSMPALRKVGA